MKELSIREKARRYDKALERARKLNSGEGVESPSGWTVCEVIFPELKESEDERVRKELIDYCKNRAEKYPNDPKYKNISAWIAWLEKQGEHKPNDKVEPKFKVGDWITNGATKPAQISSIEDDMYYTHNGTIGGDIESIDKDYHLWTIADAKDGDMLHSPSHHLIWIYKDNEHYHTCVNMNYVTENVATNGLISIPNDVCPANEVERFILFQKMKESNIKWKSTIE